MKISAYYQSTTRPLISVELSPQSNSQNHMSASMVLSALDLNQLPIDYVSITNHMGTPNDGVAQLAHHIQMQYHMPVLQHLPAVGQTPNTLPDRLSHLVQQGIQNLLVIRGDGEAESESFTSSVALIEAIKSTRDICVGAAIHTQHILDNPKKGLENVEAKIAAGTDFFISQMFFDNRDFLRVVELLRQHDIQVPIVAGIMPITNAEQLKWVPKMTGQSVPDQLMTLMSKNQSASQLEMAGITYAAQQIKALIAHDVDGIHIFSMNQANHLQKLLTAIV
ncbi:methylenetetrahydrofolate reductase [Leuconostoc fallax]|uniref:methylenetetrahydrofolate reductase n=1 Tax=Leuconostoc fallax TaxID=1251 RepID=UPI002090895D|nr:methylenetetrahydrofolate reductase [Leuconostoc fallax]MCO6183972.1 methylenetetrahydrofolate reductase [Leuconostoc fallax]